MHTILRLLGRGFLFVLFVSKATAQTQIGGISEELAGTPESFQNINNRRFDRSINAFEAPQRLVFCTLELPFANGSRWLNNWGKAGWLISSWQVNGLYTAQSGSPLFLGTSTNLTNSLDRGSRPNNNGRSARLSGEPRDRLNRWFDTSVFSQPLAFTFGNVSRTLPDARNLGVDGRMNQHFRAEVFNALNRVPCGDPGRSFGSPQFGNISPVNSPRLIQVALKLSF